MEHAGPELLDLIMESMWFRITPVQFAESAQIKRPPESVKSSESLA